MSAPNDCTLCPLHVYGHNVVNALVIGSNPELMIVGEGPGIQEDIQGLPFVGPTGAILKQELALRGIKDYVLTNATRCYPGDPKKDNELNQGVEKCLPFLMEDIEQYKPKVILCLGAVALKSLGFDDPMDTVLNHVLEGPNGIPVVVSYHPAYFMRFSGSIHLFELAVYRIFRILNGLDLDVVWEPTIVDYREVVKCKEITIDCETDSVAAYKANIVLATISCDHGTWLVDPNNEEHMRELERIWTDESYRKNFQNGDYDIQVIERKLAKRIAGYAWDTMLAEHLKHEESRYGLEILRGVYTNQPVYERELRLWKEEIVEIPSTRIKKPTKKEIKAGITKPYEVVSYKKQKRGKDLEGYADVPREILVPYAVYDSQTEHLVMRGQQKDYPEHKRKLLQTVVLPMQLALADMEREGIKVDVGRLPEIREYYTKLDAELQQKVWDAADEEFKLTSPKEVKRVLFDELGLPEPPIRSKTTGELSTGKKSLDWLVTHANHPIVSLLEEWRGVDTLRKTFLGKPDKKGNIEKGLMSHLIGDRLYTTFRLTLETGRNSSSPNLQNLPVESKGPMRELFIADEGNLLIQADYSQIELRIAAYESGETKLIEMLEAGADIHTLFARRLYPFEPEISDGDWKEKYDGYRTLAKRFTFGRLYGQSASGMALVFNISREEAERFQQVYADLFPKMAEWWEKIANIVRAGVPLRTVWGRERFFYAVTKLANIKWRGKAGMFSHMEREALNFMPQGSAADCLSYATGVNIRPKIVKHNLPVHLRLVVHDSLTVECPEEYKYIAGGFLKTEMEAVGELFGWKLPVDIKCGRTWAGELGKLKL